MRTVSCPVCGATADADAPFCGACGSARSAPTPVPPKPEWATASKTRDEQPQFARATIPEIIKREARARMPFDERRRLLLGGALGLFGLGLAATAGLVLSAQAIEGEVSFESGTPVVLLEGGVPDGTVARGLGATFRFAGGRAMAPVEASRLDPGRNEFELSVGDGSETLTLDLLAVVSRDEVALAADPPTLGVVVEAPADAVVFVDGRLAARGLDGFARAGVPARTDAHADEHVSDVRVNRGDEVLEARVHLHAVPAPLELRQPPASFVTDRAAIELDATVSPTATVTLDGRPIVLTGGRARATLSLPHSGDYTFRLDVTEPGTRRRTERLHVRRVDDLASAAGGFRADPHATLDTLIALGDRPGEVGVHLRGTVAHVRIEAGRSLLEVLVPSCAGAARCAAWVEYPAVTPVRVGDPVEVYGRPRGQAQYHTEGAPTLRAPAIDAAFVIRGTAATGPEAAPPPAP